MFADDVSPQHVPAKFEPGMLVRHTPLRSDGGIYRVLSVGTDILIVETDYGERTVNLHMCERWRGTIINDVITGAAWL